jgi:hypothetical protein
VIIFRQERKFIKQKKKSPKFKIPRLVGHFSIFGFSRLAFNANVPRGTFFSPESANLLSKKWKK